MIFLEMIAKGGNHVRDARAESNKSLVQTGRYASTTQSLSNIKHILPTHAASVSPLLRSLSLSLAVCVICHVPFPLLGSKLRGSSQEAAHVLADK